MQFDVPTSISWLLGILATIVTLSGAYGFVIYVRAQKTDGGAKALSESNEALRNLLNDKEKEWNHRFEEIHKQQLESAEKIGALQGKVEKLESQNGNLEGLILQSLDAFWKANPEIATRIQLEVGGGAGRTKKLL